MKIPEIGEVYKYSEKGESDVFKIINVEKKMVVHSIVY